MILLKTTTVALVGNPNTGKTTLFNALSGMRQRTGNYPGVTVETKKGYMAHHGRTFELIDLPGTYSLAPRSPDEMVAVDLLLGHQEGENRPDVIISLVDASNLERNLYLTTQLLELGVPVVVALNMIDLARVQGITVDAERLGRQLGVPVVPIQANKHKGLEQLKQAVAEAADQPPPAQRPTFPEAFEHEVDALRRELGDGIEPFIVRRLLLDVGGWTEQRLAERNGSQVRTQVQQARQRLAEANCGVPGVEARARYAWIRQVTAGCLQRPDVRPVTWTDRIDQVLTHRLWGTLVFVGIMFLVFQSIFTWATPLMDLIDTAKGALADQVAATMEPGPLRSLLVKGIIEGVGSVVIFLPQILILFLFIAVLEDCGYMARAAFLMDKLMSRCGLSGKSFIPMLSSVACAIPGIMATRVIENPRDRLTTILVAPLMSCSARLPVYILLIAAFLTDGYPFWLPGLVMFAMYALGIILAPLVAWVLKRTLLRGETPVFVMEMPLYKVPSLRTVVRRVWDSGTAFLRRAGTIILASMVVVWALLYFPASNADGQSYELLIAAEEEAMQADRDRLAELQESIADQLAELEAIDRRLRPSYGPARLFGLLNPSQAEIDAWLSRQAEIEAEIAPVRKQIEPLQQAIAPHQERVNQLRGEWVSRSILGQVGHAIAPVVRPLGWDWKIGMAAVASFPAREVVVGTLGIIYNLGEVDPGEISEAEDPAATELGQALRRQTWPEDCQRKVFTVPTALSLMVFFALCAQCASTLAIMRRETNSWRWPIFTFMYMTGLAYVGALVTYQVGSWW
jgi:ferrous iron transport protein B